MNKRGVTFPHNLLVMKIGEMGSNVASPNTNLMVTCLSHFERKMLITRYNTLKF
jgi:hypothetical protein